MPDSDVDDGDDRSLEDQFEDWYQERVKRDEKKKNRNRQPKDFGDFLDRVAEAVWDRADAISEERRKAREDADEEPSRGEGQQSAFSRFWQGDKAS